MDQNNTDLIFENFQRDRNLLYCDLIKSFTNIEGEHLQDIFFLIREYEYKYEESIEDQIPNISELENIREKLIEYCKSKIH